MVISIRQSSEGLLQLGIPFGCHFNQLLHNGMFFRGEARYAHDTDKGLEEVDEIEVHENIV
ncbi:hypothetical protein MKX08_005008 [Trichoderma sp. CBMAI-0020]|nr:hypothetical protein MKX08_005008 [Trichoderma sp. CBMAI-0020]